MLLCVVEVWLFLFLGSITLWEYADIYMWLSVLFMSGSFQFWGTMSKVAVNIVCQV